MSAPDWHALVAAEGADPAIVAASEPAWCRLRDGSTNAIAGIDWWYGDGVWHEAHGAAESVRAALEYLRAPPRARIAADTDALRRLGG